MLRKNFFEKIKYSNGVSETFSTILEMDKLYNKTIKINNFEETISTSSYIFNKEDAIEVAKTISLNLNKNIYLINEAFNEDLKNSYTNLSKNFYYIYLGLLNLLSKNFKNENQNFSVSILNMINNLSLKNRLEIEKEENDAEINLEKIIYLPNQELKNDIALLRNIEKINIFLPVDVNELKYLLKISTLGFLKGEDNGFSYFRISADDTPLIYEDDFFDKENSLREWTGLPEKIYFSKNLEQSLGDILLISCGHIMYNVLIAAKDLEEKGFKVNVLKISLLSSSSSDLNQKIKDSISNFLDEHKNILVVEEHSKIGGLASMIAEISSSKNRSKNVVIASLGIEDDLSPRNIVLKGEEIVRI